jgi:pimeloyl-ACP methyl ester carboxylesterase
MNDHAILASLEAASPEQFAALLRRPSEDEARVYRTYFGAAHYERLRRQLLGQRARRAGKRGHVVVLHGIMGGELTVRHDGKEERIWMHLLRLAWGAVGWMRMDAQGRSLFDVRATGILKKWYADQIVALGEEWNVQTYWYDWRRDLDEIADDLATKIGAWFGPDAPVHLVAHSMGGLVSRTFIHRHPRRWAKGGKLVMLGTPNHGSFAIPQLITGAIDTLRKLDFIDVKHNLAELTEILAPLPGALQMLPSPLVMPSMARLYQSATWRGRVPQGLLDRARRHHDTLADVVDPTRMHYIAGCNRRTHDDVRDWQRLDALDGYGASLAGDGTVPHRLGFLEHDGTRIPTWFVQEDHGKLPNNEKVIAATQRLLIDDRCDLSKTPEGARGLVQDRAGARAQAASEQAQRLADEARLQAIVERLGVRSRAAGTEDEAALGRDEVEAAEILLRQFLGESERAAARPAGAKPNGRQATRRKVPEIQIAVRLAGIEKVPPSPRGGPRVDAIAVGHYIGVAPQNAEAALDEAISPEKAPEAKRILAALHRRGALGGQLGLQFLLPDPRDPRRAVVLAGMGRPGRFREAELTVLVRELAWMLGRTGRKHLTSVLIGSGVGNLEVDQAVTAWLRGLRRALNDAHDAGEPKLALRRVTFVENSPGQFVRLHRALSAQLAAFAGDPSDPLRIDYDGPSPREIAAAEKVAVRKAAERAERREKDALKPGARRSDKEPEPIRISVRLQDDTYEFSALTATASIPQRTTTVDPKLIGEINRELPLASEVERQRDLGHLLGRMLLPAELRDTALQPGVPTVLAVDATTARIHFELAALSAAGSETKFAPEEFVGLAGHLTRQLRTRFAPLPEPPLAAARTLRVLVIADPCAEAPLPGAQEEGAAVAELFEQFPGIEVVPLFGPSEATRVAVLDRLVNQRFDVVHYAGHAFFHQDDPPRSGWLFSGEQVLTAYELSRLDRVPRFVFSNACESGITPDRADRRSELLAPSFAEAFFDRGVANFICTAWPVDDAAALAFAQRIYRGLLGLEPHGAEPLHKAMWQARVLLATSGTPGGLATWGAYQHYGDPYFRLGLPPSRL